MTPQVHSTILHEIVRIIDARARVPECVKIRGRTYQVTYLEDHKRRIEEAIHRHDANQLSMLYGQLASKVKYQFLRQVASRSVKARSDGGKARGAKRTARSVKTARPEERSKSRKRAVPAGRKKVSIVGTSRR